MHGGPCAYLDASELCDVNKHHHEVATGDLPKAKEERRATDKREKGEDFKYGKGEEREEIQKKDSNGL